MAYICNFPDIMRIRWSGLCKTDVSSTWRLNSTERRLHNFDKERRKNDMAFLVLKNFGQSQPFTNICIFVRFMAKKVSSKPDESNSIFIKMDSKIRLPLIFLIFFIWVDKMLWEVCNGQEHFLRDMFSTIWLTISIVVQKCSLQSRFGGQLVTGRWRYLHQNLDAHCTVTNMAVKKAIMLTFDDFDIFAIYLEILSSFHFSLF